MSTNYIYKGRETEYQREYMRKWRAENPTYEIQQRIIHKEANKAAIKRWEKANPNKMKAKSQRHRDNLRIRVFNLLGGPKCVICNCDEILFLEIHHINGGGGRERRTIYKSSRALYNAIATGKVSPNLFEVRCRLCNHLEVLERRSKTAANRFKVIWLKENEV